VYHCEESLLRGSVNKSIHAITASTPLLQRDSHIVAVSFAATTQTGAMPKFWVDQGSKLLSRPNY